MHAFIFLARLILAAVFGVAAAAKLADYHGSSRSMATFGVPVSLAPMAARVVPLAEAICAAALLSLRTAWWGAVGAGALLSVFTIAVGSNMMAGRAPDCRCFGQIKSTPAGWPTLVRNLVFLAVAASLIARGIGPDEYDLSAIMTLLSAKVWIFQGWVVALLALWAVAGLWLSRTIASEVKRPVRHAASSSAGSAAIPASAAAFKPPETQPTHSQLLGAELPIGTPVPSLDLKALDGRAVSVETLSQSGLPVLLVFTRPHCPACDAVMSDLSRWQRELVGRLIVLPISNDDLEGTRKKAVAFGLEGAIVLGGGESRAAYGVDMVPGAVLVKDGCVASALATGRDDIRAVVDLALRPATAPAAMPNRGHVNPR